MPLAATTAAVRDDGIDNDDDVAVEGEQAALLPPSSNCALRACVMCVYIYLLPLNHHL